MSDDWLALMPPDSDEEEPEVNQRQRRINNAFQVSKESYKNELVVLSPSFFSIDVQNVVSTMNGDRWGSQNLGRPLYTALLSVAA